jgi:glycosyltransferase involved in cell wall biosynthesis
MAIPSVTVLVDTYNHERFIEEALVSVLEQDFPADEMEILVVDDGSTDRTPEIVCKFEPRVRLLRKPNGGQASAFNFGIPQAHGEIIAFLDGDDWWARNKLTRVAEAMAADASLGIVGNGIIIVHRDGSRQSEILREGFRFRANTVEGARLLRRRGSFLGTSRMTLRRQILQRIGSVPEAIRVQADEYLSTLAAALGGALILEDALTFYRLHDSNAFQLGQFDVVKERRIQKSLAILVASLLERLERDGVEQSAREAAIAYTRASAERLRLAIDGGWPWETASAEWRLYAVSHPEAPVAHRVFKSLTLLAALVTSPRAYYRMQRRLAESDLYRSARRALLPNPQMPHIRHHSREGSWQSGSAGTSANRSHD